MRRTRSVSRALREWFSVGSCLEAKRNPRPALVPADPVWTKDQTSDPQLIGPRASLEKSRAVANWIRGDEPGSDGFPIVLAPIPCYPTDSIDLASRAVRSSKPTVGRPPHLLAQVEQPASGGHVVVLMPILWSTQVGTLASTPARKRGFQSQVGGTRNRG